jgi:hypothetical protein
VPFACFAVALPPYLPHNSGSWQLSTEALCKALTCLLIGF